MQRAELDADLDQYLEVAKFGDYCPNGLQVEGTAEVLRLVTGVTASVELLSAAIDADAHAVLVHHGYFWRGEDARVIGTRRRRIALLIAGDVNLYAFHLPGEVSEHTVHLARESGVAFIAAGPHATERYGVQALGAHLEQRFGIEHLHIDSPNPV